MLKKLLMVAGVLAIVSVTGMFTLGTAFAQGPAPTPPAPWGPFWGGVANGYSVMSDALTKLLGMTWQQIYDARAAGKTLSDIAKSKGISDQKVTDAMLATLPAVLLIPRERQSLGFDRILWVATFALAFIGALLAPTYLGGISPDIDRLTIAQVPVISTVIGAAAGSLSINTILWLMDRFDTSSAEQDSAEESPSLSEEENVGTSPTQPWQP